MSIMNQLSIIRRNKLFAVILQLIPMLLLTYTAQILFKIGASSIGEVKFSELLTRPDILLKLVFNWRILLGFVLAGLGAIIYLVILSKNDFTLIFPILGALGFLILPFIGHFILKENITVGRIIGTVIISIGMIVIALSKK